MSLYCLTKEIIFLLSDSALLGFNVKSHIQNDFLSYDTIELWENKYSTFSVKRIIGVAPLTPSSDRYHIYVSDFFDSDELTNWTEVVTPNEFNSIKNELVKHWILET